jgi:uncharacterized protein (DUF488 family)
MRRDPSIIYTIGHSSRPIEEFLGLLMQATVTLLVDVRAFPHSRANPQYNGDALSPLLSVHGVLYRHLSALGGRRHRDRGAPPSVNTMWRHSAFRNYADYAMTREFLEGLDELVELASLEAAAIMCSEAVWWRCHRRIVTDYLLTRGIPVSHILAGSRVVSAELTPGAQPCSNGTIMYPGGASV